MNSKFHRLTQTSFFYGWIVLGMSFLGLFLSLGIRASFGAYVSSWEQEFSMNRTFIALISTISLVTYGVCQPITGRMNDRYGARMVLTVSLLLIGISLTLSSFAKNVWQLAFLYGVTASIGFSGGSNVTATSVAAKWFSKKRGLAMGIVLSGMAVGQLSIVPFCLLLVNYYHWRFSMLVIGLATMFVFVPIVWLMIRSRPEDIGLQAYGDEAGSKEQNGEQSDASRNRKASEGAYPIHYIMKERVFWQLTIPYFICGFTDMGLIGTHFIPLAQGNGFEAEMIAFVYTMIALGNLGGTIWSGHLSDRVHRAKLLSMIYLVRGIMLVLLISTNSLYGLILFGVFYGLTEMASIAPTSSLCASLYGRYSVGTIFGFVSVSHQIGAALGSFLPGVMYDLTGSYQSMVFLAAALLWGSALVVRAVPDHDRMASQEMNVQS